MCVQIAWLLNDDNWHEAPRKPTLFTSSLYSGQSIKVAFSSITIMYAYVCVRVCDGGAQIDTISRK